MSAASVTQGGGLLRHVSDTLFRNPLWFLMLLLAPDLLTDLGATVGLLAGSILVWLTVLLLERLVHLGHHDRPGGPQPDPGRA